MAERRENSVLFSLRELAPSRRIASRARKRPRRRVSRPSGARARRRSAARRKPKRRRSAPAGSRRREREEKERAEREESAAAAGVGASGADRSRRRLEQARIEAEARARMDGKKFPIGAVVGGVIGLIVLAGGIMGYLVHSHNQELAQQQAELQAKAEADRKKLEREADARAAAHRQGARDAAGTARQVAGRGEKAKLRAADRVAFVGARRAARSSPKCERARPRRRPSRRSRPTRAIRSAASPACSRLASAFRSSLSVHIGRVSIGAPLASQRTGCLVWLYQGVSGDAELGTVRELRPAAARAARLEIGVVIDSRSCARARQPGADRGLGDAELRSDERVVRALDDVHAIDDAQLLREARQRCGDVLGRDRLPRLRVVVVGRGGREAELVDGLVARRAPIPAQLIDERVVAGQQPGPPIGPLGQAREAAPGAQQRVLHEVVGIERTPTQAARRGAQRRFAWVPDQVIEARLVRLDRSDVRVAHTNRTVHPPCRSSRWVCRCCARAPSRDLGHALVVCSHQRFALEQQGLCGWQFEASG